MAQKSSTQTRVSRSVALGRHATLASLRGGSLRELIVGPAADIAVVRAAKQAGIRITRRSRAQLDRLAGTPKHQDLVAVCVSRTQPTLRIQDLGPDALLVAFDGLQDPRNMGACLRAAAVFGADGALAPKRRSASLTPVARKAASGGDMQVPLWQVSNLARELRSLKDAGLRVFGADAKGATTIYESDLTGAAIWVFGNESSGLRHLTQQLCDQVVRIPHTAAAVPASLNVSVACGICLAETMRQRAAAKA